MKIEIDVEQFAKDIKAGKSIGGANGALGVTTVNGNYCTAQ
ncbi:hypothetical protein [Aliarcobacter cryaerophilus]